MYKLLLVCALVGFVAAVSDDYHAEVRAYSADVNDHGFNYNLETTNGIRASSVGDENGNVHGSFGWTSPEGKLVETQYDADENGYRAVGNWIPTPPPIPDYILRAINYISAHPPRAN